MSSSAQPCKEQSSVRTKRCGRRLLSTDVRERLRNKRKALKLSQTAMARFFNVYWTTYRKWECGETTFVSQDVYKLIERLVTDDFDEKLSTLRKCGECEAPNCPFRNIMPDTQLLDLLQEMVDADNKLKNTITFRKFLRARMEQTIDEVLSLSAAFKEEH